MSDSVSSHLSGWSIYPFEANTPSSTTTAVRCRWRSVWHKTCDIRVYSYEHCIRHSRRKEIGTISLNQVAPTTSCLARLSLFLSFFVVGWCFCFATPLPLASQPTTPQITRWCFLRGGGHKTKTNTWYLVPGTPAWFKQKVTSQAVWLAKGMLQPVYAR